MNDRPDPDELLALANAEAERERRGKLKVFFGATAGVGKTFAMLEAAQELKRRGIDVVVGVVESVEAWEPGGEPRFVSGFVRPGVGSNGYQPIRLPSHTSGHACASWLVTWKTPWRSGVPRW